MNRRILNLIVGWAALALMACQENGNTFDATGTFETEEVTVAAKATGELLQFDVVEGQEVSAGDVVGHIESDMLQLQKDQLHTQRSKFDADEKELTTGQRQLDADKDRLNASKSQMDASIRQIEVEKMKVDVTEAASASSKLDLEKQLGVLRQQLANQRRELKRFTELYNDGAVARKQVDDIQYAISVLEKQIVATEDQITSVNKSIDRQMEALQLDKDGADAKIEGVVAQKMGVDAQQTGVDAQKAAVGAKREALEAQRNNIDVQLSQIDRQIENTIVSSPLSGTIIEKYVQKGEYMAPGKPMFKVADTKNMIMRAYVTSQQLEKIKVGQKVAVTADYGNNLQHEYSGVVNWISPNAEFTPKTILTDDERADLVYAVKIAVRNDGGIKIGMYGKVRF